MFYRKFVILCVAMLMAALCARADSPSASFNNDPYTVNVGYVGEQNYQGSLTGRTFDYNNDGETQKYLLEICNYSGYATGASIDGGALAEDYWRLKVITGGGTGQESFSLSVETKQETIGTAFYLFVYHDRDNTGTWTQGDEILDSTTVGTN